MNSVLLDLRQIVPPSLPPFFFYSSGSRAGGPAEGAEIWLPGDGGPHSTYPPEQQAGQPGAHLQALEVEEKEK